MKPHALLTTVCAMALAVTAGCGSSDPTQGSAEVQTSQSAPSAPAPGSASGSSTTPSPDDAPADAPAQDVVITISDFAFDVPASVPAGAEITVTNQDGSFHTVTADDGTFDVDAPGGESVTFTAPDAPGEYPLHCGPHPNMTATLVVV